MNINRLIIIKQFLVSQLNHWSLFCVAFGFILILDDGLKCGQLNPWEWGIAGIVYFLMYLVRKYTHQLWASIMLYIPIVILFALVPMGNWSHCAVFLIFGVIYAAMSIRHQMVFKSMTDHTISMPVMVGIAFLMLGLQHYFGIEENDDICKYIVIFLLVIYFLQYYLEHYLQFIDLNRDSTGCLPAKEIFGSGVGMVSLFTAGTIIVLLLSTDFVWLKDIMTFLKDTVFAWLRNLLGGMSEAEPVVMENPGKSLQELADAAGEAVSQEETFLAKLIKAAGNILISVAVVLAVVLLILELVKMIRDLMRVRTREEELGVVDTYEKIENRQADNVKPEKLKGITPQMKIRRLFKKKVIHEKKMIIGNASSFYLNRFTSGECEKALNLSGMAEIYDKARYSEEKVTDEDVKAMKESIK